MNDKYNFKIFAKEHEELIFNIDDNNINSVKEYIDENKEKLENKENIIISVIILLFKKIKNVTVYGNRIDILKMIVNYNDKFYDCATMHKYLIETVNTNQFIIFKFLYELNKNKKEKENKLENYLLFIKETVLPLSLNNRHVEITKFLLNNGIKINNDKIINKKIEILGNIILNDEDPDLYISNYYAKNLNINEIESFNKCSILSVTIRNNNYVLAKLLLDYGCDPNIIDRYNRSAMDIVFNLKIDNQCKLTYIKLLLDYGGTCAKKKVKIYNHRNHNNNYIKSDIPDYKRKKIEFD